jgi:hypothetical protein
MMSLYKTKNLGCGVMKIGDIEGLMIISRAFDQIQVFVQMLGGYFLKSFRQKYRQGNYGQHNKVKDGSL